jgi:hypothetical protein
MLEAGLYKLLTDNAADLGATFYPGELPKNAALPAGTYTTVVTVSEPTLETSGAQKPLFQFDCYGNTALESETLRDALRVLLNGFTGLLDDGTYLDNVDLADMRGPKFDPDRRMFYCALDFRFIFDFS